MPSPHFDTQFFKDIKTSPSNVAVLNKVGDDEYEDQIAYTVEQDDGPLERRQIGLFSAIFIIFNRIIGTG